MSQTTTTTTIGSDIIILYNFQNFDGWCFKLKIKTECLKKIFKRPQIFLKENGDLILRFKKKQS